MRPDMSKLLCERGHAGRAWTKGRPKGWRARCRFRNAADEPAEAALPPRHDPTFSENLRPLQRWIAAQVGRPWAKVLSELRAQVDARSAVQLHILQHLEHDLAVRTWQAADGATWYHGHWGPRRLDSDDPGRHRSRHPRLYVCPRTGLLRRVRMRHAPQRPKPPPSQLDSPTPGRVYRLIDGQWYEWWKLPPAREGEPAIIRKRQLAHRELRRLGLRPDQE